MKIWMDLTNSPHVSFFRHLIGDLADHQALITCRPLANTIDLLDDAGFDYTVVGSHYGAGKLKKLAGFPLRVAQLRRFLSHNRADVAVSHSSYYSPAAARISGIPSIYINDNEHARGNWVAFPFASVIMLPDPLAKLAAKRHWPWRRKILPYPGVKEGIYLWPFGLGDRSPPPRDRTERPRVFVRPEPWTAHYYGGNVNVLDRLLRGLAEDFEVTLLPRDDTQKSHYRDPAFQAIRVPDHTIGLETILRECDLFIGAGGTMTRETAVMGIPTISVYQDELLEVDRFLIARGALLHKPGLSADFVRDWMTGQARRPPDTSLLDAGKKAYTLIRDTLLDLGHRRTNTSSHTGGKAKKE